MRKGLNILVGISAEDAMRLAHQQMEQVDAQGGVRAAILDLEHHYKRPLTEDERNIVGQAMTLGVCVSYCILGQSLAAIEADMKANGIDPIAVAQRLRDAEDEALKSSSPADEHEAERLTHEVLMRARKPSLH